MSGKKEKTPFRVKMSDGSIETVYAYSEKQALYLASKSGKKAVEVVGILMKTETKETPKREQLEVEEGKRELFEKLEEALKNGRYLEAIDYKIQIQKLVAKGEINWDNKLEKKYRLFGSWWNK